MSMKSRFLSTWLCEPCCAYNTHRDHCLIVLLCQGDVRDLLAEGRCQSYEPMRKVSVSRTHAELTAKRHEKQSGGALTSMVLGLASTMLRTLSRDCFLQAHALIWRLHLQSGDSVIQCDQRHLRASPAGRGDTAWSEALAKIWQQSSDSDISSHAVMPARYRQCPDKGPRC